MYHEIWSRTVRQGGSESQAAPVPILGLLTRHVEQADAIPFGAVPSLDGLQRGQYRGLAVVPLKEVGSFLRQPDLAVVSGPEDKTPGPRLVHILRLVQGDSVRRAVERLRKAFLRPPRA